MLRQQGYQLKYLLKAMPMSKSTYDFELSKVDLVDRRNTQLKNEVQKIFTEHKGRYGVRRVYQELLNRGFIVNHKRVQRLMHCIGIAGKQPKEKYYSYKGKVGKVAENIVNRDFSTTAPLQKWTTDVSQFIFSWGKCYLSPILDMNTNEIVAYELALKSNLEQVSRMLKKAFKKFTNLSRLIFHSDQGWQYQHNFFRNALKEYGIIQFMPRKGNCYDNSVMENFFGGLKTEIYYGFEKKYSSFNAFAVSIEEYINYYNNRRIKKKQNGGPCKIQGRIYVFSLINNIIYGQENGYISKNRDGYSL